MLYNDTYLTRVQDLLDKTKKKSLSTLNPSTDEKIADMGCGPGELSALISKSGAIVYGIDRNKEFIKLAKEKNNPNNLINFVEADLAEIPLSSEFLDKIVVHRVLQHIENHKAVFKEFNRVLKPSGLIHIVEPDYFSWSFFNKDVRFERKLMDSISYRRIPNAYKVREIPFQLKSNGFKIISTEVQNYVIEDFKTANYLIKFDEEIQVLKDLNPSEANEAVSFFNNIKSDKNFNLSVNLLLFTAVKMNNENE